MNVGYDEAMKRIRKHQRIQRITHRIAKNISKQVRKRFEGDFFLIGC